jgi:hypothetical protein
MQTVCLVYFRQTSPMPKRQTRCVLVRAGIFSSTIGSSHCHQQSHTPYPNLPVKAGHISSISSGSGSLLDIRSIRRSLLYPVSVLSFSCRTFHNAFRSLEFQYWRRQSTLQTPLLNLTNLLSNGLQLWFDQPSS